MLGRLGPRAAAVVLLGSLAASGCSKTGVSTDQAASPTSPTSVTSGSQIVYTALGSSDAVGVGASVPCLPFAACPDGTGYVPSITRRLAESDTVSSTNLGIPASVLTADVQALGNRYGRNIPANFIQGQVPFVPRTTTLVTVVVGANDATALAAAIEAGAAERGDVRVFVDGKVVEFKSGVETLVRGVRQRAPGARIIVANLPNFAGLPFAQSLASDKRQVLQRITVGFSRDAINTLPALDVSVVDLLCDPRSYDPAHYSSDGFHFNDRGYAFITEALIAAIRATTTTEPAPTCAHTAVVPPL